ncbi:indoleamine 2,3-dioxygenase-2 [Elsinoe australis]|uniref:Indoleamine 2,3-dioxygenase n=1 Tax=Elsinoe australis TaxID=40998 RepID=A0A4U7AXX7_9PEZI|nr:indoleamine 2,3-dioxygenase-2 [Elsinoe australis]
MLPSIPRLEDYDVSEVHGFLPTDPPLSALSDPYYRPWENLVQNLQPLILSKRLRGLVDDLPVLTTDHLKNDQEWRRAYVILAFLSHAYIWGGDTPSERVPPSISIPFTAACNHLELPLVATYAGVCLWNWRPIFPDEGVDSLENLSTLHTFTGSLDESWFYLVSVAIEARGAPIVPMMLDAIEAARYGQTDIVTECLRSFAERLDELGSLLQRMYENCDPHVFYHRIRPFLAGSKNMRDAGLPNGVIFDTGSSEDTYVQYSGGSNAQSSIIQFFDIALGIEHRPTGQTATKPATSDPHSTISADQAPPQNFIHDMRTYMPGAHARFLRHVESIANIRQFVRDHQNDRALATAYDACLAMLRAFRDKHIQMVSRYIIVKSRESRSHSRSLSPREAPRYERVNLASRKPSQGKGGKDDKGGLRGTGGTSLIPFLKQARDETGEPAIDAWARRLLGNGPGVGNGVRLGKMGEHASGEMEIVGLAGVWSVDDSDGGICHW